jgi:HAD superfamily hydrolase (TIGR01459 family)
LTSSLIIPGLSAVADRYEAIFCDVWGVVHNGISAHAEAGEALARFRSAGGKVVMISNAPRPYWSVIAQLDQIGVRRDAYDAVVTSGDVTLELIRAEPTQRCYFIGAPKDEPLFRDLSTERVDVDAAAFIVCAGLRDDERETAEDYRPLLQRLRARNLSMISANPDLVVERGHRLLPCAGAIAALYEELGGRVVQAGKPHPPIYARTRARAAELLGHAVDPRRVLAIGDAIRTDVAGAVADGVDSLFLSAGIHAGDLHDATGMLAERKLEAFLAVQALRPTAVMRHLSW